MAGYRMKVKDSGLVFDVDLLKAMGDETRSRILSVLCTPDRGAMIPSTVTELALRLGLSASTVSHHLQLLLRAGLVLVERQGKERHYTLDLDGLRRKVAQFHELLKTIERDTREYAAVVH